MEIFAVRAADPYSSAPASSQQNAERARIGVAIRAVNDANIFGANNELTFARDRMTQQTVIRVVDRDTHEVVAQLPPEYVLRLAEQVPRGGQYA